MNKKMLKNPYVIAGIVLVLIAAAFLATNGAPLSLIESSQPAQIQASSNEGTPEIYPVDERLERDMTTHNYLKLISVVKN